MISELSTKFVSKIANKTVTLSGNDLTIEQIVSVSQGKAHICITPDTAIRKKIILSQQYVEEAVKNNHVIYGVTTNFGGMANTVVNENETETLQSNLIYGLKSGVGQCLAKEHIRAGMLLRANSLVRGVSGIRLEIIERLCAFLNANITPFVYDNGSIGASGDLVPLSYIAGVVAGLGAEYKAIYNNTIIDALEALKILNLHPLTLKAKEGLALVNGTSLSTGVAANCTGHFNFLFNLALYFHAFYIQALQGSPDVFHPFVHSHKAHPGQIAIAKLMRQLLADSKFTMTKNSLKDNRLIQDRYSIRCLPQYLGIIYEGLMSIKNRIEIEANSANDNPIIDVDSKTFFNSGNFLGEYISVSMDQLRHYLALVAKHIDAQVALIMSPEFNQGLPPSLAVNNGSSVKFGLKGLQLSMNAVMSELTYYGNAISHLFSTHCEQFNQNINSLSYSASTIAWKAIELLQQYLAMAGIVAIQSVELRAYQINGNYDARAFLSPSLIPLYEIFYSVVGKSISHNKPLIFDDHKAPLDNYIQLIVKNMGAFSKILRENS